MTWEVEFHVEFASELDDWPPDAVDELHARAGLLAQFGPALRRPHADTLKGSRHSNMKELRFDAAHGAWRVAFAFDPERRAILLVGGDKSGQSARKFYKGLVSRADARFDEHLAGLQTKRGRNR